MNATPAPPLLAWVDELDPTDRQAFYDDLASAVATAQTTGDHGDIELCLRSWRLTAKGMSNAELRDQLLEP